MPKTIFVNIKKGQKMAKWPNHFISGKQFQKGQIATLEQSLKDVKKISGFQDSDVSADVGFHGIRQAVRFCSKQSGGNRTGTDECSQFHQHFTYKFLVQMLFWRFFSSYMYVEKAAKMTFIQKICT